MQEAMSRIWEIHPEHVLFINTTLWQTLLLLGLLLSHTHTSLWIHMVCYQFTLEVNETKIYARGCGTETIPIIQVMHATWDFLTVKTPLLAKMIIYLAAEPCWSCFEFNILHNSAPCKKIVFNFSCLLDKVKRLNTSTWITVRERF